MLLFVVAVRAGFVGRLSDRIIRRLRRCLDQRLLVSREVLHEAGRYGVVRIGVDDEILEKSAIVGDTGLAGRGVKVLAIERGDTVIPLPGTEEPLQLGDRLLCYGEMEAIRV